jgi:hypothetical protein
VRCDSEWICRSGEIRGWIAAREFQLVVKHDSDGTWFLNDHPVPGLQDCVDLDFGFTPATNFTHLRRLNLGIGQSVTFPVAWIDVPSASLQVLPQHYERRDEVTYWYDSPTAGYAELLTFSSSGFVADYPSLWRLVS